MNNIEYKKIQEIGAYLNSFSLEEIRDKAYEFFKTAPCQSNDMGICLYRGPNNTKCVVGYMIPDELYTPELEKASFGTSIDDLNNNFEMGINTTKLKYYSMLQVMHDRPDNWEENGPFKFDELYSELEISYNYFKSKESDI